jgi:hypothetical protein
MANDVATVLSSAVIDLSASNFIVIEQQCDFFESWEEQELGYHGVVTARIRVQNIKQS